MKEFRVTIKKLDKKSGSTLEMKIGKFPAWKIEGSSKLFGREEPQDKRYNMVKSFYGFLASACIYLDEKGPYVRAHVERNGKLLCDERILNPGEKARITMVEEDEGVLYEGDTYEISFELVDEETPLSFEKEGLEWYRIDVKTLEDDEENFQNEIVKEEEIFLAPVSRDKGYCKREEALKFRYGSSAFEAYVYGCDFKVYRDELGEYLLVAYDYGNRAWEGSRVLEVIPAGKQERIYNNSYETTFGEEYGEISVLYLISFDVV